MQKRPSGANFTSMCHLDYEKGLTSIVNESVM
jgi:hypothetical protein